MKTLSQNIIIELREILSQMLSDVLAEESSRIILARRPLQMPSDIHIKHQPMPTLRKTGRSKSNLVLDQFTREAMHAIRIPTLCYVMEGKFNIRLGLPSPQGKFHNSIKSYHILTLPARTFLYIPLGVFYGTGAVSHREEPSPAPDARLFWMHIFPTGAFCITSSMREGIYTIDHFGVFAPSLHLTLLMDLLRDDLLAGDSDSIPSIQGTLLSLLSRVRRGLNNSAQGIYDMHHDHPGHQHINFLHPTRNSTIIERADAYIQVHIGKPLSIEDIANNIQVSPSHLMRLFRNEIDTTVMKYVLKQRLLYAQSLLANTTIPIQEISRLVGYQQTPQFNRVFKRNVDLSPTQFRRKKPKNADFTIAAKK